jgi:hypothetical protein
MRTSLYLKAQSELVADCQAYLNDTGITLASATQYKEAVNYAIRLWAGRVIIPNTYTLSLTDGVYTYALPRYIKPPITVKAQTTLTGFYPSTVLTTTDATYEDVAGYTIEPDGNDGFTLRLSTYPYAANAFIIYYMENTVLPTGSPTVTSNITSSDTSVSITLSSMPELGDSGFVKIDNEWIAYSGISRGSSGFTLSNLVRAYWETTAASHTSSTAVSFGIGADRPSLWNQLYNQVAAYVHNLNIQKSTGEDSTRHQQLMQYHQQLADNWWRQNGYVTPRKAKLVLSPNALGSMLW